MITIDAKNVYYFRGDKTEFLLLCWEDNNIDCWKNRHNMIKLAQEDPSVDYARVMMDDLKSTYHIPESIKVNTIFSIHSKKDVSVFVAGTIYNPNYEELKNFYYKCKNVSVKNKSLVYTHEITNISPINNFLTSQQYSKNLKFDANMEREKQIQMKILSPGCKVFQFIKKKKPKTCMKFL